MSSNRMSDACLECALLLGKYEAATFEQAKIHNALDRAQHLNDPISARRLKLEAYDITARRRSSLDAYEQHQDAAHRFAGVMGEGSRTHAL